MNTHCNTLITVGTRRPDRGPRNRSGIRIFRSACFLFLSALFSLSGARAAKIYPSAGTTSASFLKIGVGARPVSMAGAFVSVSDPYSIYWNPAGLYRLRGTRNVSFSHNEYFQGLKQEFILYSIDSGNLSFFGKNVLEDGVLGFSLNYFSVPKDLERRSGANESDPLNPLSSAEGKFSAYDLAFSAAYAFRWRNAWDIGAALKFIRQSIDNESGSAPALDVGIARSFSWTGRKFRAGFSVSNLGPGIKFVSRRYDLPLIFRAGLSHRPTEKSLISFDIEKPIDNYPYLKIGTEQKMGDMLVLRGGYKYRINGNELGAASGLSAGIGFNYKNFSFDYAFSPYGELGNAHILSFSLRFGKAAREKKIGSRELTMSYENLEGGRTYVYEMKSRPKKISAGGVLYDVRAFSDSAPVYEISFKAMMRGPMNAGIWLKDGKLPPSLSGKLPRGKVLNAFQLLSNVNTMASGMEMSFRIDREYGEKGIHFLYLARPEWREGEVRKISEDENYVYFKARVPRSSHYAVIRD